MARHEQLVGQQLLQSTFFFAGVIAAAAAYILGLHQWTKLALLIYVLPMCARVANYPTEDLHKIHNFSSVFMLLVVVFYLFICVPQASNLVILFPIKSSERSSKSGLSVSVA